MKKNFNIMSDDLTISKLSYSDSVWSLEKGNIINTQKKSHWMKTSQGVHSLDFNVMMNIKIISSS